MPTRPNRFPASEVVLSAATYPFGGVFPTDAYEARSRGDGPAMTSSTIAASVTVRASGPATSRNVASIGTTPGSGTSPNVAFMPTSAWADDGFWIEPPVSVPMPRTAKLALTAVAEPPLEPPGSRSSAYGLNVWPATVLLE